MDPFIIDREFAMLTQELSDAEYEKLEEDIFDKGCTKPLHIWNGILLDGHKRYDICRKWGIPYTVKEHTFDNREEAIVWICTHNSNWVSNPEEMYKFLIGRHYEAVKANYLLHCNAAGAIPKYHYRLAGELGTTYGIAPGTVYKYGMYARSIMKISQMNPEFGKKIINGYIKISQENVYEISKYTVDSLKRLYDFVMENKIDHICYSEIRQELLWKPTPTRTKLPPVKKSLPADNADLKIKQMPAFDPDAEISSLTLTIP